MATIQLDFPHDINVSVQVDDLIYWVPTVPVGVPGTLGNWASTTTPHDTAPREDVILMGPVIEFIPWNGDSRSQLINDGLNFNTINTSLALPNSGAALDNLSVMQQAIDVLPTLGLPGIYENEDPYSPNVWYRFSDQSIDPITFVSEVTNTSRINFPPTINTGLGQGATGILQGLTGLTINTDYGVAVDLVGIPSLMIDFYDTAGVHQPGISGTVAGGVHEFSAPATDLIIVISNWSNFNTGSINRVSVIELARTSIIVDYPDALAEVYGPPSVTDFIMFSKDNKVNLSSLLGYYSRVQFRNNSTEEGELFAVGADFVESSK